MKKLSLVLLAISLMSSIVTGCGGVAQIGSKSDEIQKDGGVTSQSKKVKLDFWALSDLGQGLREVIKDYKVVNPSVEIRLTTREIDPHKEALKVAAVSSTLPDMWFNWGGSLGSYYSGSGLTMDLTNYAKKNDWSNKYVQSSLDMATLNGQLAGVPVHIYGLGFFYRKDIFDKYQIKVPKTFQELEAAIEKLRNTSIIPIAAGGKGGWHTMRLVESLLEHFAGPEQHDNLMSMKESWNSEAVIKTSQKWKEWSDKGYFPDRFLASDPSEARLLLYHGQAAMILETPWFDQMLNDNQQDKSLYGFFPFPTDHNPARVSGYIEMVQINKHSSKQKQEAALKFAEFLTSRREIQKHVHLLGGPHAVVNAPISNKMIHVPRILKILKEGVYLITDQALPQEVVPKFFQAQDAVITGEMTPETAAQFVQDEIENYKSEGM